MFDYMVNIFNTTMVNILYITLVICKKNMYIYSCMCSDSEYMSAAAIESAGRSADMFERVQEALVVTGLRTLRVCVCARAGRATSQLCRGAALLLQYVYKYI